MAILGEGAEYEALIEFSSAPGITIASIPFSQITWQRTKNSPSTASVTIPGFDGGIEACGTFGGLRPWDHMLVIERNGYRVWDGPIMGWAPSDDDGGVTINARDRSILLSKCYVGLNRLWKTGDADLGTILATIINDSDLATMGIPFNVPPLFEGSSPAANTDPIPGFSPRDPADVDLHVERLDTLASVFTQIGETTEFFYTQVAETLEFREYVARGGISPQATADGGPGVGYDATNWPVLSNATVLGIPKVTVDGASMGTTIYVGGASQGANGHPFVALSDLSTAVWYVSEPPGPPYMLTQLQVGTANLTQTDDASIESAAEQLAAASATPNATIEQAVLSPDFGSLGMQASLRNLLPGVRMVVSFEETCAFNVPTSRRTWVYDPNLGSYDFTLGWSGVVKHVTLDQLDVEVGPDGETVKASLTPTVQIIGPPLTVYGPGGPFQQRMVY